jgi:hypothetical protein
LGKFRRVLQWNMLVYFSAIWYILWPFGVYFVTIWYILRLFINYTYRRFGTFCQEESGNPGRNWSRKLYE